MNAKIRLLPVLLLTTCALLAADTTYYRWVNDDGVVQFSDEKPKSEQVEKVGPSQHFGFPLQPKPDNQSAARSISNSNPAETQSAAVKLQPPVDDNQRQQAAEIKKANCKVGLQNLQQLEAYKRITIRTPQGGIRTLSRTEKTAAINRANSLIRENC